VRLLQSQSDYRPAFSSRQWQAVLRDYIQTGSGNNQPPIEGIPGRCHSLGIKRSDPEANQSQTGAHYKNVEGSEVLTVMAVNSSIF
jgi:hypothetical protein